MYSGLQNPDHLLVSAYAQSGVNRQILALALEFDDHIRHQVFSAREPMFGQLRLAWWREQIDALRLSVTGLNDPLLIKIATLSPDDVMLGVWTSIIDGWEILLSDWEEDVDAMVAFAKGRGRGLFGIFGDQDAQLLLAGEGWALADLAFQMPDPQLAARLIAQATPRLAALQHAARRSETRALRVLAALAALDVAGGFPRQVRLGSPRRMFWALRYALAHRAA
jgi:15-cis-phytoene synthase